MPFSHLVITVRNINKARDFYVAALKPLGYKIHTSQREGKVIGIGEQHPEFWIAEVNARKTEEEKQALKGEFGPAGEFIHLAFSASNREQVDQFYAAAIAAGAKDNGAPGLRPQYAKNYYGAFVFDPEGRNIEAVYIGDA